MDIPFWGVLKLGPVEVKARWPVRSAHFPRKGIATAEPLEPRRMLAVFNGTAGDDRAATKGQAPRPKPQKSSNHARDRIRIEIWSLRGYLILEFFWSLDFEP